MVEAHSRPGLSGGEDRFHGLVDRVVQGAEDGPVTLDGMVEDTHKHRRWAGAGQLSVGPDPDSPRSTARSSGSAVSTKSSPSTSWSFPTCTASSAAIHLIVLISANTGSLETSRTGGLRDVSGSSPREPGRPNSFEPTTQLLGAGVAKADPDERVPGRRGTVGAAPVLIDGSRGGLDPPACFYAQAFPPACARSVAAGQPASTHPAGP